MAGEEVPPKHTHIKKQFVFCVTRGWPDMDGVYTQNNEMLSPYSSPRQLATRLHIVNGLSGYNKKPLIGQC